MITLYSCNPNADGGAVFLAASKAAYKAHLETNFKIKAFTEDSYRLNENTLIVAEDTNLWKACYVLWEYGKETRFYFIDRYVQESGFYRYEVHLDLWATYIYDISTLQLRVRKSTKTYTSMHYPAFYETDLRAVPALTYPDLSTYGFTSAGAVTNPDRLSVVFFLSVSIQEFLISDQATATLPLVIGLNDWITYLGTKNVSLSNADALRSLCNFVANAISANLYIAGINEQAAKVLNAYIIPTACLTKSASKKVRVTMSGYEYYSGIAEALLCDAYILESVSGLDIPNTNVDLLSIVYCGSKANQMPVAANGAPATSGGGSGYDKTIKGVSLRFFLKADSLSAILRQGNHAQDMTDIFKISILYANGDASALRDIQAEMGKAAQSILSIVTAVASQGNPLAVANAVGTIAGNTASSIVENGGMGATPRPIPTGGDAMTTYLDGQNLKAPLVFAEYWNSGNKSFINEINESGLIVDESESNLYNLKNYLSLETLGSGKPDFVQATLVADKAPTDALYYICSHLASGIKIFFL